MKSKKNISTKEYEAFLRDLVLLDIRMLDCHAHSDPDSRRKLAAIADKHTAISVDTNAAYSIADERQFDIAVHYRVSVREPGEQKELLHFSIRYLLSFESATQIRKEIFDLYAARSLPLHTWPYLREFVSAMCSRMGIKPITLPLHVSLTKANKD